MAGKAKAKEKRADQDTEPCATCQGDGTVPGDRYTDPARPCPTCKGRGVVPADEGDGA